MSATRKSKSPSLVFLVLCSLAAAAAAQTPSCAAKLVPCQPYLNTTNPPDVCCGPLKDAVQNELSCLCAIFNSPEIFKALNIDLSKALELAVRCGTSSDTSLCKKTGAPGPSASSPPGAPGDAARTSWIGMSGLLCYFLFWFSIVD